VEVDIKDYRGRTPLSWAAEFGREGIVKLLLHTGKVDVGSKDNEGLTPLCWATQNDHEEVVEMLLEFGKVEVDEDTRIWTPSC
jgi:ankyrin repeat protein